MKTGFSGNFYLRFERVKPFEPIPPSALFSFDEGNCLQAIESPIIGRTPDQCREGASFWVPVQITKLNDSAEDLFKGE